MEIRNYAKEDAADLWRIYFGAIRYVCCRDYSDEQIRAWAPDDFDQELWAKRIEKIHPNVAVLEGQIVGYADLQDDGLIDHFFVDSRFQRQGVGHALMSTLLGNARTMQMPKLYSYVSKTAKEFYLSYGFVVVETNTETIRGVELTNYLMEQVLNS